MREERIYICSQCGGYMDFDYLNEEQTLYKFRCQNGCPPFIAREVEPKVFKRVEQFDSAIKIVI